MNYRLKLFGGVSIETSEGPVAGRAAQRRRLALLALLGGSRSGAMSRDKLIAYLWPEADAESGRRFLSDSVYRINKALGGDAIVAVGDDLRLDPRRVSTDVGEFEDALAKREYARAAELCVGPFLDGFFLSDAPEFERWVDVERERRAREHARALEALAESADQADDRTAAVEWWKRLAALEPLNSRVSLRLMRALDAAGERAAAIQYATEHGQRLRNDLDLEPDADVVALADLLRNATTAPKPTTRPLGRARSASVAVLPFRNLSADRENEYFADGITEDVIAQLAKIRALKVISRASVMRFKDRQQTLREIGATLGATTLLDGSVRRAGDRVRVVAQLIDAESDHHLWSETFDRDMTDIFAIQTEVALRIAGALEAELSPDEQVRVHREPTSDVLAYQLYLQGRAWLIRYTGPSITRAIEYFDRATARDPTFALAHASAAMAYIELVELGVMAPDVAYRRASDAAANALRLDPELGAAHCAAGYLKALRDFDWAGAEQGFKRALELSPSGADVYDLYGRLCAALERYDESITLLLRAQELDPLAHRVDIATAMLRAGRYDEAVVRAKYAVELDPFDRARATLGWAYFLSGKQDEGLAELERAVAISPGSAIWLAQLGEAYALAGRETKAREILGELEARSRTQYVSPYHFAYLYTGLGETDRAMDCLERAVAERAGPVYAIKGSFLFTPLRTHPRFKALLRRMNLG
jgi:TolB-like protein/Tfp pilus assembly protein PilF